MVRFAFFIGGFVSAFMCLAALLGWYVVTWAKRADAALEALAEAGEPFTADDLLEAIGPPDIDHAPNAKNNGVGAAFSRARKAELIHVVGHAQSRQPKRKGGLVRVWRGGVS